MEKDNKVFKIPVIITKGVVAFPFTNFFLSIEREHSKKSFDESIKNYSEQCILVTQLDDSKNEISSEDDIAKVGTFVYFTDRKKNKNGYRAFVNCTMRAKIINFDFSSDAFFADVEILDDPIEDPKICGPLIKNVLDIITSRPEKYLNSRIEKSFLNKIQGGISAIELSYLISNLLAVDVSRKQQLLEAENVEERLKIIIDCLNYLDESDLIEQKINDIVRDSATKSQKEYILREKMRAINKELGDDETSFEQSVNKKLDDNPYPEEVKTKIHTELKKLKNMPAGSLEGALVKDYIENVMNLPWYQHSEDTKDIKEVKRILDEDHYGLEKVKSRILEYLAVKTINNNLKAPILCLYGPPGVGKTSLSRSIARALNRKFVKCSLGGIDDEAQIRGHIRTYVGSRPGIIIRSLNKVKVNNPVFLLDEIDKLGRNGLRGDPSSALLEVLDPEQNVAFNDHYLEISYNLSNVLFICTANDLNSIPGPLMDRLELIEVDSYTLLDKVHIAKDYLIKKELVNTGLNDKNINFDDEAIEYLIERYTRESGVRNLERRIADCLRKVVVKYLSNEVKEGFVITKDTIKEFLGIEDFDPTMKEKDKQIGVMTGLAYSSVGGSILPIEVNYFEGNGKLTLTGKLGDVMKESCAIAYSFIKANYETLNIDKEILKNSDIHIHFPEGAIPKDGPSAGCATCCAIVSALIKKPISGDIAMTGEISLRGKALAIGGLKEKTLAALRSGIKTIFVPLENKKNVLELPHEIQDNIKFIYMESVLDALKIIFDL